MITQKNTDLAIQRHLCLLSTDKVDYWSFRGKANREHCHGYFQYPAMMVPQLQRELIETIRKTQPSLKRIFDPYVGSGTILTETVLQGLNFAGIDINPLAILSCQAKSGPFRNDKLSQKVTKLIRIIQSDRSEKIEIDFPGLKKWFELKVSVELSKIRRAIQKEETKWCRRFFWIALAETVRLSSNSRISTFKLHIRALSDLANRDVSPLSMFSTILASNLKKHLLQEMLLRDKGYIINGKYKGEIELYLTDSTKLSKPRAGKYDLLITSPPYGDNVTTVPYGQYSYLPLQWIDLKDIDNNLDNSCLDTTNAIDSSSLGGSRRNVAPWKAKLFDVSPSLKNFSEILDNDELLKKVIAFSRDLYLSLTPILASMKADAYTIWTLGNRRVGGEIVPLDAILREFLLSKKCIFVEKIERKIPTKRMAIKNNIADTMSTETILIMRISS